MSDRIGDHAVVIGAGMAGLLAARALSEAYAHVTVVERDTLPAGPEARRAVPQGRHAHALLPRGEAALEELLPGLRAELRAAGAPEYRALEDMRFAVRGHVLARAATGRRSIVASRAFIEHHVRRRVAAIANVTIADRCDVRSLVPAAGGAQVAGVRVAPRDGGPERDLDADLVVAASGRGGQLGAWLRELGFAPPPTDRLDIDLRYASMPLRLPDGALERDRLILHGARPDLPRTLALFVQEDGRRLLTLGGYGEHRPPGDPDGFAAFAASVAPPDVAAALRDAEPLGGIATFRFPASVRHRFERSRLPGRLLPIGDAVCSFNPLYGQGMTVAALEALALRRCLAAGDVRARTFLRAIRPSVDDAWELGVGGDLAQPFVAGRRPARVRLVNAYVGRLLAAAEHDHDVALAFLDVVGMLERPPSLLRPAVARRVLPRPRRRVRPAATPDVAARSAQPT